jgi:hypothetical protein
LPHFENLTLFQRRKGGAPEGLNDIERKLVAAYRKLSPGDQENVLLAVNAWAGKT